MNIEATHPKEQPLTKDDIKTLESMFIQSGQEMRTIVSLIELGLWKMYRDSKNYRKLVKLYGAKADDIVKKAVHEELSREETYKVGKIMQVTRQLIVLLDGLSTAGIEINPNAKDRTQKECAMWDSLQYDGKMLAWRHAMMCNIDPSDDIKVDSALKALAKDHTISDRVLERLEPNAQ